MFEKGRGGRVIHQVAATAWKPTEEPRGQSVGIDKFVSDARRCFAQGMERDIFSISLEPEVNLLRSWRGFWCKDGDTIIGRVAVFPLLSAPRIDGHVKLEVRLKFIIGECRFSLRGQVKRYVVLSLCRFKVTQTLRLAHLHVAMLTPSFSAFTCAQTCFSPSYIGLGFFPEECFGDVRGKGGG